MTALVTATVLLGGGLLIAGAGSGGRGSSASADTTPITPPLPRPQARASAPQANVGPEGVPLTKGVPLGPPASAASGASRGGVPCGSREQLTYHVHARLTLFVKGKPRAVPLGIGIGAPRQINHSVRGDFVSGGSCFSFLHTHASDGVIHIEAPGQVTFKLGQFFDVWDQRLDRHRLGSVRGRVVAYVNGKRWGGDPRAIPLRKHDQIQLDVGRPLTPPVSITFPSGL